MKAVEIFDYEELCVLIPILKRASKRFIENELSNYEVDDADGKRIIQSLKEKIGKMDESEIRKLFDELPSEAF